MLDGVIPVDTVPVGAPVPVETEPFVVAVTTCLGVTDGATFGLTVATGVLGVLGCPGLVVIGVPEGVGCFGIVGGTVGFIGLVGFTGGVTPGLVGGVTPGFVGGTVVPGFSGFVGGVVPGLLGSVGFVGVPGSVGSVGVVVPGLPGSVGFVGFSGSVGVVVPGFSFKGSSCAVTLTAAV